MPSMCRPVIPAPWYGGQNEEPAKDKKARVKKQVKDNAATPVRAARPGGAPPAAQRIGVFGGTFDPVHNAHVAIARAALEHARLDRVLFVVAARPPHKSGGPYATPEERAALVDAAIGNEPGMELCRIEIERKGPSYMVDTLRTLAEMYPGAEFYLIVGEDSVEDLPRWKDAPAILERARILAVPRPGSWRVDPVLEGRYERLPFEKTRASSTEVRERIVAGKPLDDLLPASVAALIAERGLYDVCSTKPQS
jgi:nicotinate-nucleotide adenylyltransferase